MVGAEGFEPPTHWSQTSCATRLRYAPIRMPFQLSETAFKRWGERRGSNPRQLESQSRALPTELRPPLCCYKSNREWRARQDSNLLPSA